MVARYRRGVNEHAGPSKFRRYRARKRAAGLREVRMWVPDLLSPQWQALIAREQAAARAAAGAPTDDEAAWDRLAESEMASWDDWVA